MRLHRYTRSIKLIPRCEVVVVPGAVTFAGPDPSVNSRDLFIMRVVDRL